MLAVDFDAALKGGIPQMNTNWRWSDQHQAVLSTCSSLITIVKDGGSEVVQFSHFSVKEFLISDRLARASGDVSRYHILLEPAHTILAQACLGVLLRFDDDIDQDSARDIPLAEYAAQHWVEHAQFENVSSHIWQAMEYVFDAKKPHWAAWFRVHSIDVSWKWFSYHGARGSPLYYAALCGFYDLSEHLIGRHPKDINAAGGRLVTPLVAALYRKHFRVAELLHRYGASVHVRGESGWLPLHTACATGRMDIVQWLMNHGVDVNAQSNSGWTPLHAAAYHPQLEPIQVLLEHGANINARTDLGCVPLHHVASSSENKPHLESMQILFDYGSDANIRDNAGLTALHHSSYWERGDGGIASWGTVEATRLLLKHGANIDAEDNKGRTPLQLALAHGREEIATFLSGYGATQSDQPSTGHSLSGT